MCPVCDHNPNDLGSRVTHVPGFSAPTRCMSESVNSCGASVAGTAHGCGDSSYLRASIASAYLPPLPKPRCALASTRRRLAAYARQIELFLPMDKAVGAVAFTPPLTPTQPPTEASGTTKVLPMCPV